MTTSKVCDENSLNIKSAEGNVIKCMTRITGSKGSITLTRLIGIV